MLPAHAVVLATGGLSVPKTGSDGARALGPRRVSGHTIHETYPALTPLTQEPADATRDLAGVSCTVTLHAARGRERARDPGRLSVHASRATAGPPCSTCPISPCAPWATRSGPRSPCEWTDQEPRQWDARLSGRRGHRARPAPASFPSASPTASSRRRGSTPRSAWPSSPPAERRALVALLAAFPLPWTGSEGYKKAEVTGGGVALSEVDPRSLESRLCPRLVPVRRDAGRVRPHRRPQLRLGVGHGAARRPGGAGAGESRAERPSVR